MGERERRIGQNEALFREVNETIRGVNEAFGAITGTMSILCECGSLGCDKQIVVPLAEYEHLRSDPTLFAVLAGHDIPDVELVVERREGYDVVRKHAGEPQEIAIETDPRADS
jgi:hypothetical protein